MSEDVAQGADPRPLRESRRMWSAHERRAEQAEARVKELENSHPHFGKMVAALGEKAATERAEKAEARVQELEWILQDIDNETELAKYEARELRALVQIMEGAWRWDYGVESSIDWVNRQQESEAEERRRHRELFDSIPAPSEWPAGEPKTDAVRDRVLRERWGPKCERCGAPAVCSADESGDDPLCDAHCNHAENECTPLPGVERDVSDLDDGSLHGAAGVSVERERPLACAECFDGKHAIGKYKHCPDERCGCECRSGVERGGEG